MKTLAAGVATLVLLAALSGCASSDAPTNEVFVLVDLSETWLNPASTPRNQVVLEELGEGLFGTIETLPSPLAFQYRIIGDASYERPPVCDVIYKSMLVNTAKKKPKWLITRPKALEQYLGTDCPAVLLHRPPEPLTEISAALASVAAKPRGPAAKRTIIVVSDFLEEAPESTSLADYDFKGVRVLLLYRPIAHEAATATRQRVTEWRDLLAARGATVLVSPDTALKRADVTGFVAPT